MILFDYVVVVYGGGPHPLMILHSNNVQNMFPLVLQHLYRLL